MRVLIKRVADGKITLQETSKIAIVTISRPEARNALTTKMWNELAEIARELHIRPKVKVVILRGMPGQFTSGSDIKEFAGMSISEANVAFETMEQAISTIESLSIPVICAMDGPAMGAGFVLSLACDIRIGTANARMGIPVGKLGIKLGPSFVRRIVRIIGPSRTKELVYTGNVYNASEAVKLGLLNHLVPDSESLDKSLFQMAETIMCQSRVSLQSVKKSVEMCEWKQTPAWEFAHPVDFPEGCMAFVEKRLPRFS
ncbi:enoyl-CoA hydratase/isomerase family protein [Aneurinibacillus sp. Ricciae_BoGa-3]|uniref:enoyl-CoA hydratase/isomerase family protein n=1 Tax=Aneurinibacillus sp. Ricciae_BoGa-3 TaxID=3022697 RepID=UPI002341E52B|nr:enoyl-CoA hydratase/isomerase family protein [Aneurinibacillus sp. Ricciae_BoGa-3]WCK56627.1 enoyl-CoA hydratase/isomerase family protein [Aneurinibacillus sp. Ricciae_BoGa-3]